jgi:hypothetical protein
VPDKEVTGDCFAVISRLSLHVKPMSGSEPEAVSGG